MRRDTRPLMADQSPLYFAAAVRQQQLALAEEITQARIWAHTKHGPQSCETQKGGDRLLPILLEEVGEVAKAMNEYALGNTDYEQAGVEIRAELIDVITVASAWVAKFEREGQGV